jgi:ADP-heptose:LPS heptosyltransferase
MIIVNATKGIDLYQLPEGQYIADDLNAADILRMAPRGSITLQSITREYKPFDETKDWNGKKILFVRAGGFGDLLFLTPSFREIRRRWPQVEIHVSVYSLFQSILKTANVESIISYPPTVEQVNSFDAVVFMENSIEANPLAEKEHAIDVSSKHIGLSLLTDKHCDYVFTEEEVAWAAARYPRNDKKRVAVQLTASGKARNYPASLMTEVITTLAKQGKEVYLLGYPGEVNGKTPGNIRNLTMENLNFRQSVAAMATCDVVLGPDSVMVHIAGAINMPAVALYGPFPWQLRTAYAHSVHAIQGHSGCDLAPCFYHGQGNHMHFPPNGPCAKSGRCEVMASIKVSRVLAAISSALELKK